MEPPDLFMDEQLRVISWDAARGLTLLEPESVDCVVTSPPYWRHRDYGVAGQLGQEPTVGFYVDRLADVFDLVAPVLKSTATVWLNLGDTWLDGDLLDVPGLVRAELGARGWLRRGDVVWHKPDAPPESTRGRPVVDHERVLLLARRSDHFYDAEAVREPYTKPLNRWGSDRASGAGRPESSRGLDRERALRPDPRGKLRRSVWTIGRARANGSSCPAVMPPELAERCILAGCPVGGTVLDPFAGSGTTLLEALRLGRRAVGIELNKTFAAEAVQRALDAGQLRLPDQGAPAHDLEVA